jgi:hypothetical protein
VKFLNFRCAAIKPRRPEALLVPTNFLEYAEQSFTGGSITSVAPAKIKFFI